MGKGRTSSLGVLPSSLSKKVKAVSSVSFVGERISLLAKAEIGKTKKNPVTKEKWLAKLRASIQKKVAVASYAIFVDEPSDPDTDPERLLQVIATLRQSIRTQCEALRARTAGAEKRFEGLFDDTQDARYMGKRSNRFDSRISRITDKFTQVASQVEHTASDLKSRIASLKSTINSVEIGMTSVSVPAMQSVGGSSVGGSIAAGGGSSALHALNQHLSSGR
jgi:hypothetical protein